MRFLSFLSGMASTLFNRAKAPPRDFLARHASRYICPRSSAASGGARVATLVDGFPKGEPKSPFGRGPGRESPGRSRYRNTGPGSQGAAMRPLVWVVRGTKALDSMGSGRAEVSLIVMKRRNRFLSPKRRQRARRTEYTHLVKIAIKRL